MASSAGDSAAGRSGEGSDGDALAVNRAWPAAACAGGSAHCGELDERGHRQGAGRRLQGNPCPMPCCLDYSARDPESSYSLSHISCVSPLSGLATYCYTPPILQPCRRCSHKPYSLPLVASNIPLQRDSLLSSQAVTALPTGPHLAALWAVGWPLQVEILTKLVTIKDATGTFRSALRRRTSPRDPACPVGSAPADSPRASTVFSTRVALVRQRRRWSH